MIHGASASVRGEERVEMMDISSCVKKLQTNFISSLKDRNILRFLKSCGFPLELLKILIKLNNLHLNIET